MDDNLFKQLPPVLKQDEPEPIIQVREGRDIAASWSEDDLLGASQAEKRQEDWERAMQARAAASLTHREAAYRNDIEVWDLQAQLDERMANDLGNIENRLRVLVGTYERDITTLTDTNVF